MQTAETYGRAVRYYLFFDESKAKHDVNEVKRKHGVQAQSGDNHCPKDISELAWILEWMIKEERSDRTCRDVGGGSKTGNKVSRKQPAKKPQVLTGSTN
jgi:hypothetical protein